MLIAITVSKKYDVSAIVTYVLCAGKTAKEISELNNIFLHTVYIF